MQENLVIVESPAKAKTIEKFLGKDYKVMSSYGHIRDLKKKSLSIDPKTLEPTYEIPEEKRKVVGDLKKAAKEAKKIWLPSDEDREGEAISWHLCEVLGLDEKNTNRIVFHEITKPAILKAIETPRHLDMNLVNAQQARRVLDRLVGFKLSPVLWRKVKPALSAGRVQSVAVRLIVDREREIQGFKSVPFYRINATFGLTHPDGSQSEVKAELDKRFNSMEEAHDFLERCKTAEFTVSAISKKPLKRSPAPPFTTSTLQQEAARKLGFTVSQTMMVAQHLYENGRITYMRTDSVNLSSLAINTSKEVITKLYGAENSCPRNYHTHSKGAQEAHEAIRPTFMDATEIEGTMQERRLYNLIWKRTAASQMTDAEIEKTTVNINISGADEKFIANGEVVTFEGFLKVYRESNDDDDTNEEGTRLLPVMTEGDKLQRREIISTERFTQGPSRYTEASLVHKLEELGIGRPSTYAPTISTIQQREYVVKGNKEGEERRYNVDTLKGNIITSKTKTETTGSEKGKLVPTDIGIVVNDFLMANFPDIMDYNFTAKVEGEFDQIAEGKEEWKDMMKDFDQKFEPAVKNVLDKRENHKAGERELGTDPTDGRPVVVKIGRLGPVVQVGRATLFRSRHRETALRPDSKRQEHGDHHSRRSAPAVQATAHGRHLSGQTGGDRCRTIRPLCEIRRQVHLSAQRYESHGCHDRRMHQAHPPETGAGGQAPPQELRAGSEDGGAQRSLRPLHRLRRQKLPHPEKHARQGFLPHLRRVQGDCRERSRTQAPAQPQAIA